MQQEICGRKISTPRVHVSRINLVKLVTENRKYYIDNNRNDWNKGYAK